MAVSGRNKGKTHIADVGLRLCLISGMVMLAVQAIREARDAHANISNAGIKCANATVKGSNATINAADALLHAVNV